ncbi:MAG: phytanoyl-CoA dioxygenase family protein [Boseongicola sp.]
MLNSTQIDRFRRDGYLIVRDVVDEATLVRVRAEYAELMDGLYDDWCTAGQVSDSPEGLDFWSKLDRARDAGVEWFQPLDISLPHEDISEETPFHFGPAVFEMLTHARVLDVAESVLGGELTSNPIQHVRIKPPQREVPEGEVRAHIGTTDWHQDRGVGHVEADNTDILTVWIAITDATVENGCLQVIPNPPDAMYPHCPKTQTAIADSFVQADRAVHAEVPAGGVVLIHPLTPHCAGPNESSGYRWSFDVCYNITGQPTGRAHFPDFVARSRAHPESELRDWRLWRKKWETARAIAANSPHIPQHRWQSDSPHCA